MATALTFTLAPAMLFENGRPAPSPTTVGSVSYYKVGNGARWKWTTSARKMAVNSYLEYTAGFNHNGQMAILVDNVPYFFAAPTSGTTAGVVSQTMRLPVGANKTVEMVVPITNAASAGATPLGMFPFFVQFDESATEISPSLQAAHLVIYGDSIASGGVAISPSVYGYAGLMKRSIGAGGYNGSVTQVSWGSRRLADDCDTAGHATTFVTALLALLPTKILLTIGSNDQALVPNITLANFDTYYQRLLDEIHSQSASMPIVCLSPIRRSTEAANGAGNTLAEFRTKISDAVTARAGWGVPPTYVNGLAIFADLTLLPDSVHPGTAGNVTMQTTVQAAV